jgi:hypothetical protein
MRTRLMVALVLVGLAAGCGGKFDKPLELSRVITMGEYSYKPFDGFDGAASLSISGGRLYVAFGGSAQIHAYYSSALPIGTDLVKAFAGLHTPRLVGSGKYTVAVLDSSDTLTVRIYGLGGGNPISSFSDPDWKQVSGLAVDDSGYVYVADAAEDFVRAYKQDGRRRFQVDLADSGFGIGHVLSPMGIGLNGQTLLIAEAHAEKVQVQRIRIDQPQVGIPFSASNPYLSTFTDADGNEIQMVRPIGVAAGDDGSIFVLDQGLGKIFQFDADGNSIAIVNSTTSGGPVDLRDVASIDTYNNPEKTSASIYVLDVGRGLVHRWEPK